MDITQLLITILAVLGIALMGAMAVVPTILEFTDGPDRPTTPAPRPVTNRPVQENHELAA